MQVYQLNNLVPATVLKRPSALIKTPYVSDIQLTDEMEPHLGHSLSLGCCGLCETGAQVYVTHISNCKPGLHCDYTVQLSKSNDNTLVGINPRIAEHIVENCIRQKLILAEASRESSIPLNTYKREYTVSKELLGTEKAVRYDFGGTLKNGAPFYLEVKNVPLATNGTAYFPDGFRKKTTDTVSPRALKHIQELMHLKINNPQSRCIICYVIQRSDVSRFEISKKDPEYRDAVFKAIDAGVESLAIVIDWSISGIATFVNVLPVT